MTESENPQGPDFRSEFQGDKPNDGMGERDTEGHFMSEFRGDDGNPSQPKDGSQDDDTQGHFMSE